jgi:hypothetical protein
MAQLPVVISPEERDALTKAHGDAFELLEATDAMLHRCVTAPMPASALQSCLGKEPDDWWLTYSQASLIVATDHLRALLALWSAPAIPHSAGYTVIRGAAEAAARACWLVDPLLAFRERIARGIVERAYALERMSQAEGETQHIQESRAGFEMTVARAGFAIVHLTCEKQERPRTTPLMESLLSGPITSETTHTTVGGLSYKLLSGYAHAEAWATLMDMQPVGSGMAMMALNVPRQIQLLRLAMRLLHTGVCWTVGLAGFDVEAWKQGAVPLVLGL